MAEVAFEHTLPGGQILRVVRGDITEEQSAAIVNAANEHLAHGGGVAGAIARRGGPSIQHESSEWVREHGLVHTGSAAITGAGTLPAQAVIHAVGPVWGSGDEETRLASAIRSALQLADEHNLASISIPGVSSGIFGGPKDVCARTIVQAALNHIAAHPDTVLAEVRFCNIDAETTAAFTTAAQELFGT